MTSLTPKETHVLRPALGLYDRSKITYRNRYYAGGFDAETWRGLVTRGLAYEGNTDPHGTWFMASRAGFEAVQRKGEKLGPDEVKQFERWEREAQPI